LAKADFEGVQNALDDADMLRSKLCHGAPFVPGDKGATRTFARTRVKRPPTGQRYVASPPTPSGASMTNGMERDCAQWVRLHPGEACQELCFDLCEGSMTGSGGRLHNETGTRGWAG
jgi:hypothetical protein